MMVEALTEYVQKNNLKNSPQDIDDMSWHGLQESKLFKDHFQEIANKNETTIEQEMQSWSQHVSKLSFTVTEKEKKTVKK